MELPELNERNIFGDAPVADDVDELLSIFSRKFIELKGDYHFVESPAVATKVVAEIIPKYDRNRVFVEPSPIIREILGDSFGVTYSAAEIPTGKFANFLWSVTTADALVARTGSLILRSLPTRGRRSFILAPNHLVIARVSQILPTLEKALSALNAVNEDWSLATIISGPSRTSDIEKNLILGAHGPRRLVLVLMK